MIEAAVELLRCPHCHGPLLRHDASLRCDRGHSFDIARQGYVNLLRGDEHLGTADTTSMVEARQRFLAGGHFQPVTDALVSLVSEIDDPGCVVDIGAGTGRHLAAVLDGAPRRVGLALDISTAALRRSARSHPRATAVGCDVWGPLPVRNEVAAMVLDVFSPRNAAELGRIASRTGILCVVTPTTRHLDELVGALGMVNVDPDKDRRLAGSLGSHFVQMGHTGLEWEMVLDRAAMEAAVLMGPSARHLDPATTAARLDTLGSPTSVTGSVAVTTWRPR